MYFPDGTNQFTFELFSHIETLALPSTVALQDDCYGQLVPVGTGLNLNAAWRKPDTATLQPKLPYRDQPRQVDAFTGTKQAGDNLNLTPQRRGNGASWSATAMVVKLPRLMYNINWHHNSA